MKSMQKKRIVGVVNAGFAFLVSSVVGGSDTGADGDTTPMLMKMLRKLSYGAFSIILQMDDMNIRGAQIFVGYKFHCRSDLDLFIGCIENRDRKMLEAINNEGRKGRYPHKAVAGGAVEGRREILTNDSHGVA